MKTKLSRRDLMRVSAAGAAGAAIGSLPSSVHGGTTSSSGRPNIVLILTDQQTGRAVGAHGYDGVETPGMDKLVENGTSFLKGYCPDPSCCPARAALFTGRMSSENGVIVNPFPLHDDIPDLGSWLQENSTYNPIYMGKWHIPERSVSRSFQLMSYYSANGENCDIAMARSFEGMLYNYSDKDPFFCVLSLYNPHDIVNFVSLQRAFTEPERLGLTDDDLPSLPRNFFRPENEPLLFSETKRSSEQSWSREKWRTYRWLYNRQLEMVDGVVDRIVDMVWNSRFADNTIIIFTSDHGDSQGEHMLVNKQALYEASARVPFIVSWPDQYKPQGLNRQHLVSTIDIVPTVCDIAGIAPPPKQRGRSVVPLLDGSSDSWRSYLQVHSLVEGRMIRSDDYKYITFRNDERKMLFNLAEDPWELNNLAEDSSYSGVLEEHAEMQEEAEAQLENTELAEAGYEAVMDALADGTY